MNEWISKNQIVSTLTIGVCVFAVFKTLWSLSKYVPELLGRQREPMTEVYMFNELGYDCVMEHREHDRLGRLFECPNEHCANRPVKRILHYLSRAKYTIDLAIYSMMSPAISESLRDAVRRGVIVRFITNRRIEQRDTTIVELVNMGVYVRCPKTSNLMHHKFCVIDGPRRIESLWRKMRRPGKPEPTRGVLINGSVNWTNGGFNANFENLVISTDPRLVDTFQSEFHRFFLALKE